MMKLATLTETENIAWRAAFKQAELDGLDPDLADIAAWKVVQGIFPRLLEYDGATDETHL